jgi:hypothetical protein
MPGPDTKSLERDRRRSACTPANCSGSICVLHIIPCSSIRLLKSELRSAGLFIETIGHAERPITGRIASTVIPGRGVASAGPVRCEIFPGIGPAKSADFPEKDTSPPNGSKGIDRSPSRVAVHCNIVSGTEMAVLQSPPGFGAAEESQSGHE